MPIAFAISTRWCSERGRDEWCKSPETKSYITTMVPRGTQTGERLYIMRHWGFLYMCVFNGHFFLRRSCRWLFYIRQTSMLLDVGVSIADQYADLDLYINYFLSLSFSLCCSSVYNKYYLFSLFLRIEITLFFRLLLPTRDAAAHAFRLYRFF